MLLFALIIFNFFVKFSFSLTLATLCFILIKIYLLFCCYLFLICTFFVFGDFPLSIFYFEQLPYSHPFFSVHSFDKLMMNIFASRKINPTIIGAVNKVKEKNRKLMATNFHLKVLLFSLRVIFFAIASVVIVGVVVA